MRSRSTTLFLGFGLTIIGLAAIAGDVIGQHGEEPSHFHEVIPRNLCPQGQGAGERALGTIFRGARPKPVNLTYLSEVAKVQTIIDLETSDHYKKEEKLLIKMNLASAIRDISHPMADGFGINQLPDSDNPDNDSIIAAVAEFRHAPFPIYAHCQYGFDRTGMTIALHRVFNECWDPKAAEQEWRSIAGWWHNLWHAAKFDYFRKVTSPGSELRNYYEAKLNLPSEEHIAQSK